jgi:predicted patatin/cPLA2 family phospholipase
MPSKIYKNLVLSGGGVRGLYYLGFMKYYESRLGEFENIVGTSIGSFFAAAIAIGYKSEELRPHVINIIDYTKVKNIQLFSFLSNLGLDDATNLEHYIKKMIRDKIGRKDITLLQLYTEFGKSIVVPVVCIQTKQVLYLSKDTFPHLKVWKAIRMSMGVPFLFKPYVYRGLSYVDGGIKHNFAIDLYDSIDTLGIDLSLSSTCKSYETLDFEQYCISIVDIITKYRAPIINQAVIYMGGSYNPDKQLIPFQPEVDEKVVNEAIEYSCELVKQFFLEKSEKEKYMTKEINDICRDIIYDIISKL